MADGCDMIHIGAGKPGDDASRAAKPDKHFFLGGGCGVRRGGEETICTHLSPGNMERTLQ